VNDEFDGLFSQRKVLDRFGVEAAVNGVTGVPAPRAKSDLDARDDREADRVLRSVPSFVNNAELREVQRVGQEGQTVLLPHLSPRVHLFTLPTHPHSYLIQVLPIWPPSATLV
jgi:hypothetical protein